MDANNITKILHEHKTKLIEIKNLMLKLAKKYMVKWFDNFYVLHCINIINAYKTGKVRNFLQ